MSMIRTVGDLSAYLKKESKSPEVFARETGLSHMTIRRWLKRPARTPIHGKYHANLDRVSPPAGSQLFQAIVPDASALMPDGLNGMLRTLEESGGGEQDLGKLESELTSKLKDPAIEAPLRSHVTELFRAIRSRTTSMRGKAVCIGALLYLINPFDLIPDTIPVIGYFDDFAVLALAASFLRGPEGRQGPARSSEEPA